MRLIYTLSEKGNLSSERFFQEPINGEQARVPIRWSWKEDWKISMFLMPFSQSNKPIKTPLNKNSKKFSLFNNSILLTNKYFCLFVKTNFILYSSFMRNDFQR